MMDDTTPPQAPQAPQPTQLPAWKEDLLCSLFTMVQALPDEEPSPEAESNPAPQPTLQEFYSALIALEANTRKNVQKTNASLDTVAKSLRALQRQMSQIEEHSSLAPALDATPLLVLAGQLHRMSESLQSPPATAPLGLSRKWQTAWADLANGAQIVLSSLAQALAAQGIHSESPATGDAFDPAWMEAIKVSSLPINAESSAPATVLETIEPAYFQNKARIRAARVHVQR